VNEVRQAVVVIHGMGEQLPLSTLSRFIDTALAPDEDGERTYYSRPESVTGSFESRRFLAPRRTSAGAEVHAQTDFFEYHWADKMQGNRLDDLWPTFRRVLLQSPTKVPAGLRGLWVLAWLLIIAAAWAVLAGPLEGKVLGEEDPVGAAIGALLSGGLTAAFVSYLMSRVLPGWLTASFVDVVRYLDTSPRSYAVRREIRKGLVEMLQGLHASRQPIYDRVVLVAHSLGAYIAYDAIAYLWGTMNSQTDHKEAVDKGLDALLALERAASELPETGTAGQHLVEAFQDAQRDLGVEIRSQGNPWLITDFVSVGTPMYFADQLMAGKDGRSFESRIDRRELPTCPPQNEESVGNNINGTKRFYSWEKRTWAGPKGKQAFVRRRVIYEGAPFAVVRWTNLYFPVKLGIFGDWFGGPLAPVFGSGIKDLAVMGNKYGDPGTRLWRHRLVPAAAHSYYFRFPDDAGVDSVATHIRVGLDLASTPWLRPVPASAAAPPIQPVPQPPAGQP